MRAFRLAFDGRPFYGFQRQPDVPTVEDAVFDALGALGVCESRAVPAGYAAAGRTDRGVSAVAQTVAFDAPDRLSPEAFNAELPETVRAWAAADVADDFHATHDARTREYTYHLYAPDADVERARATLDALSGRHDFHNLTTDDRGTVRTLSTALTRDGNHLVLTFRAGGFARGLVRRLVTLVDGTAGGELPLGRVDTLLGSEPVDGSAGVGPAPAAPLVLTDVEYGDRVAFDVDPDAAADTHACFETLRVERTTGAQVAREVRDGVSGGQ